MCKALSTVYTRHLQERHVLSQMSFSQCVKYWWHSNHWKVIMGCQELLLQRSISYRENVCRNFTFQCPLEHLSQHTNPRCASQQLQRMIGLLKGWNCTLSDHFKNSSRFCKAAPSSAHVTRYGNKYKIPEWVVLCKHSELANIVQCCKEPQRFI